MRLMDMLAKLDYKCLQGTLEVEIDQVVYDSRKDAKDISGGAVFICIEGAVFDGHKYAAEMVEKEEEKSDVQKSSDQAELIQMPQQNRSESA